jgi:hypothetical protein
MSWNLETTKNCSVLHGLDTSENTNEKKYVPLYFLREARTSRGFGVWFIISIVMKYICGVLHLIKLPQLNNETTESK